MKRLITAAFLAVFLFIGISGCYTKLHAPEPATGEVDPEVEDGSYQSYNDYDNDYDLYLRYYYPGYWSTSYYTYPYFHYGYLYGPVWYAPYYYYGEYYYNDDGQKTVRRRRAVRDLDPPLSPGFSGGSRPVSSPGTTTTPPPSRPISSQGVKKETSDKKQDSDRSGKSKRSRR
jgi:hypothetical protein